MSVPVGVVGLVGCSMTVDAAEGYRRVGGTRLWRPAQLGYGGGTIHRWSDPTHPRGFWERFEDAVAREPETGSIWWELCTDGSAENDLERARSVLAEIQARLPNATIYVSAQPGYADGHVCRSAGPGGPEQMAELAGKVSDQAGVEAGPALSPLRPDQLTDTCHANTAGKEQMGMELLQFFGAETG